MKTIKTIGLVGGLLVTGMMAQATLTWNQPVLSYTSGALSTTIPDNNPVGVVSSTGYIDVGQYGGNITGVTVGLNVSGGFNSDLYAYLVSPNGTLVELMNQPSAAYGSSMNITLVSSGGANGNLSSAGSGALSGSYNVSGLTGFGTTGTPVATANGSWSLFFADLSAGGTSTLNSWSLNLTVVPEPVEIALGIFAATMGGVLVIRRRPSLRNLKARFNAWLDAA